MVAAVGPDGGSQAALFSPKQCPRLVVKIGSSLLYGENGSPRRDWLEGLVAEIAARCAEGQDIIVVCSGAVALGARRLGLPGGGRASLADAQASASVGQIALAGLWAELLAAQNLNAAQILLTLGDLEDRRRFLNVAATLGCLLDAGAVPVVNENDCVATEEIRFGGNDRLAARVAQAALADGFIILSDVAGLYDSDPGSNSEAKLIREVHDIDDSIAAMATSSSGSGIGTGGMTSKIEAAKIAGIAGIPLAIASGREERPLSAFAETGIATVFLPPRSENARKSWLGGRLTSAGSVSIDAGAIEALRGGKSLLPAGVVKVDGSFARGDVIDILSPDGECIARGLAEYDAGETASLMGRQSSEAGAILGYAPRSALVHRDHMVLL